MRHLPILVLCILFVNNAIAGGPKKIAKINRALWPYKINSVAEFDFASRMEMLVFANVFNKYENLIIEDSLKKHLGLERISIASINRWKSQIRTILLANFNAATTRSPHDFVNITTPKQWQDVISMSGLVERAIPENLKAWHVNATEFYETYTYEQLRLAALFPRTTSEILTLQDSEIIGTEYSDRQFLLTFDDGPTVSGGNTDKLITTLKANHVNGVFFVLGDMLNTRLQASSPEKIKELYEPMMLASHGKVHVQHPKSSEWQNSLSFTSDLINSITHQKKVFFRPPYGQRNDAMINYLNTTGDKVVLWNIDSQDWNAKIKAEEVGDRVITLMLLWRRGIILFHDIHPKANIAVPIILGGLKDCNIQWLDAKKIQ